MRVFALLMAALLLAGCAAKAVFHDSPKPSALTYFDPQPYLMVETARDCSVTTRIFTMPGQRRSVEVTAGFGSADVAIGLKDGMITSLNQKVDTAIPATIGAIAGAAQSGRAAVGARLDERVCLAGSRLYPIDDGRPDMRRPIMLGQ